MSQVQQTPQLGGPTGDEPEKPFKPVETSQSFQGTRSKIDEDPFALLLETQKKKDKARCEAWKDEVQNLLIFAGLFSAVVTAFIIESYKGLKQDSSEVANVLLLRILAQLEGSTNGTATAQSLTMPMFSPEPSAVRINILWFLSLIFSLATVLIGIIALQWLREHLRPQADLEPQIAFSLHHLNLESLDRWYLPQIFTALPLLLQVGLVLFLAGISDFLWNLNHTVAVPIAVAVGFSLFFLLWTTVLPTMQALSLLVPRWPWTTGAPSPCPYRSPQSWAFYQLLRPLVAILLNSFWPTNIEQPSSWVKHRGLVFHSMTTEKDRRLVFLQRETTSCRRRRPINLIFRHNIGDSWTTIGIAWLFQRDLCSLPNTNFQEPDIDWAHRPVPIFDTVKALIDVGANGSLRDALLAHKCVEPIVHANKLDKNYMSYLFFLVDVDGLYFANIFTMGIPADTIANQNTLLFHLAIARSRPPEVAPKSVVELFANATRMLIADGAKPLDESWLLSSSPLGHFNFSIHPGGQEELLNILESYFSNAVKYHPEPEDAGKTTYFSRFAMDFVYQSAATMFKLKPTSPLFSQHQNLLQSLATSLQDLPDDPAVHPPPDYLFFASLIYVHNLLRFNISEETIKTDIGQNLILAILQYHARATQLQRVMEYEIYRTWSDFERDWPEFVQRAEILGVVLPPPAVQLPTDSLPVEGTEIQELCQVSGDAIVDVRVDPLGKRSSSLQENASVYSSSEIDGNDVIA